MNMRQIIKPGRPVKYDSPKQMAVIINKYFQDCERQKKPMTVAGLAYALDMTRQSILNYAKKDGFLDLISRAKERIGVFAEEALYNREYFKGAALSLKNNHGWTDKSEINVNVNHKLDNQLMTGRQKVLESLEENNHPTIEHKPA